MNTICGLMSMTARHCLAVAIVPMLLAACTATQQSPDDAAGTRGRTGTATSPAAVAAPAAQDAEAATGQWHVLGTEPFWSVRVDGASLLFATPEDPEGQTLAARGERNDDAIEFRGEDRGKPFVLRLMRGECSDGMSDRRYAYNATFEIAGTRYSGCANEGLDARSENGAG